jgi:hypothetical protein
MRCSTSARGHGIGAEIELIPADEINEAYERVLARDVRYGFVIDTATSDRSASTSDGHAVMSRATLSSSATMYVALSGYASYAAETRCGRQRSKVSVSGSMPG